MNKLELLQQDINPNNTRKNGKIPISIHCKNFNKQFAVDFKNFTHLLQTLGRTILSSLFLLKDGQDDIIAIAKEIQIHPVTEKVVHVDFFRVFPGQEFLVPAQVVVKNFEKAPFVLENGIIYLPSRTVKILCTTETIKNCIECDIGHLHKGDVIQTTDPMWKDSKIKFLTKAPLVTIVEKS